MMQYLLRTKIGQLGEYILDVNPPSNKLEGIHP